MIEPRKERLRSWEILSELPSYVLKLCLALWRPKLPEGSQRNIQTLILIPINCSQQQDDSSASHWIIDTPHGPPTWVCKNASAHFQHAVLTLCIYWKHMDAPETCVSKVCCPWSQSRGFKVLEISWGKCKQKTQSYRDKRRAKLFTDAGRVSFRTWTGGRPVK